MADTEILLDPEDQHLLAAHRWYLASHGYVRRTSDDAYLHRVVAGCMPGDGLVVDHLNRCKHDNRRSNLRVGSQAENMANVDAHVDAVSRHKGVYPFRGRWQAWLT
jgi:hypothetical protein